LEFLMYVFAASTTIYAEPGKGKIHLTADEPWAADDPFVRAHPELFVAHPSNPKRTVAPRPAVEQATAAPGERRGVRGRS
jgi:hypothetical protein